MRIAVLGAGIAGMTTAYWLAEAGHELVVVDAADTAACGASGDNGGQLSWSFTDALASPSFVHRIPGLLAGRDLSVRMRPDINPSFLRWSLGFLSQCTRSRNVENTLAVLELAMESAGEMAAIRKRVPVEFGFRNAGKLVMLQGPAALKEARKSVELKTSMGMKQEVVSFDRACEIEPALSQFTSPYSGAIWSGNDQVGDTRAFTTGLGDWLAEHHGVEFRYSTRVTGISIDGGQFKSVSTQDGEIRADCAVVCLGAHAPALLHPLGIRVPIQPVRGYSITLPPGSDPVDVSVTDQSAKMVFSRINGAIRMAGFADFVGFRTRGDLGRAADLLQVSRSLAPRVASFDTADSRPWAGFRPMTPDSRPVFGPSKIRNLHLNTGHGMLGWTLAAATARRVARGITGS